MKRIKMMIILISLLSVVLILVSIYNSYNNQMNNRLLNMINIQKSFTQEISKNIFYIYRDREISTKELDNSIQEFINYIDKQERVFDNINSPLIKAQNSKIVLLWNSFYLQVQNFRNQTKVISPYSNILTGKVVKDIYNINLQLIVEFEKLIKLHNIYFDKEQQFYKSIELILFLSFISLLIYLIWQLKDVMLFIQKFLDNSKKIITNATIKGVRPISVDNSNRDVVEARDNFNLLVKRIDSSIQNSSEWIQQTAQSLELVEKNIEDLFELINLMDREQKIDKELIKKEDILIQLLEELTVSSNNLSDLKGSLDAIMN
ncbi:MAG: hypothetical protein QM493_09025 [Sulfurovum sp.]